MAVLPPYMTAKLVLTVLGWRLMSFMVVSFLSPGSGGVGGLGGLPGVWLVGGCQLAVLPPYMTAKLVLTVFGWRLMSFMPVSFLCPLGEGRVGRVVGLPSRLVRKNLRSADIDSLSTRYRSRRPWSAVRERGAAVLAA